MAGGRPTKYTEELLAIAREYPFNFNTEHDHSFPSIVGLAKVIRVNSDTIYDWAKQSEKKEFSDILKDIMDYQHLELMEGGISGKFNPTISKLILTKHGHSEKSEVSSNNKSTIEHSGSVTVTTEEAKQISQALNDEC